MTQTVCNYFKYGYCKFVDKCNYLHVQKICDIDSCDVKLCNMRHPKLCKFYREYGRCKFGEWCAYRHTNENDKTSHDVSKISSEVKTLKIII